MGPNHPIYILEWSETLRWLCFYIGSKRVKMVQYLVCFTGLLSPLQLKLENLMASQLNEVLLDEIIVK